ncbi:hypothetical protein [uncultured Rheinheimera sp.]|uniref:hypothetical protein n=1 Tax=uncultured Rheinheimera sp. TaxID=400532 RepID=UPI0025970E15|nr:hypothetical protein [uncultured Rheinheimera sp.]
MVYFIVILGLLVLGGLVGNSLSTPNFNSTFWSMFSAIGSWAGGIAAAFAAFIALKIADRQIDRDNYRIQAFKEPSFNELDIDVDEELKGALILMNFIIKNNFKFSIKVANTGLRPIQMSSVHFNNNILTVSMDWPGMPVIQPGCSDVFVVKLNDEYPKSLSVFENLLTKINSADEPQLAILKWMYNSEIMLEVATGDRYLVAEKSSKN